MTTRLLLVCLGLIAASLPVRGASQIDYDQPPARAVIPVPVIRPADNPLIPRQYYLPYGYVRAYAFADFNADGAVDIVVAPTFFDRGPRLPIAIFLQQPAGTFVDGTSQVVDGPIPVTSVVTDILIADFNEDGRPDIFLVDQGLEDKRPTTFEGAPNTLLLSQANGRLADASSRITPNPNAFNHNGVVADLNEDGHLDIIIADIGVTSIPASGVFALLGDGRGNFTRSTSGLPRAAAYMTWGEMHGVADRQSVYAVALGDLDADGRLDLITTTGSHLRPGETHNIRFYQRQPDGAFVEKSRWQVPPGQPFSNLGIWRPGVGDINGDGLADLAFHWDGWGGTYVGVLRNDGAFRFTDITVDALGTYDPTPSNVAGYKRVVSRVDLIDINRDGLADLLFRSYGEPIADLVSKSAAYLSEGNGTFSAWSPATGSTGWTSEQLLSHLKCAWCNYVPFFVDASGDGIHDLLLIDHQSNNTPPGAQTTALVISRFLGNLPAGSTATAIEYYHSAFDHYFITASTDEIAKLDAGVFAGWTRTNLSFGVYGLNSSGASNVCRFFSTSFAPKSSHFYTPLQTECDAVKQNADWQFEGQVFGLRLPDTAGNCSSGTAPLYRLYNSGLSGAPNHRYTSNAAIRSQMMIQGWIPEGYGAQGVIGCVPL